MGTARGPTGWNDCSCKCAASLAERRDQKCPKDPYRDEPRWFSLTQGDPGGPGRGVGVKNRLTRKSSKTSMRTAEGRPLAIEEIEDSGFFDGVTDDQLSKMLSDARAV